jgi:small subunit ribosomal protein S1
MSILTQRVEIYSDSDPLNSTFVDIPVHKGEKIMCHEPYVVEAMKMYAKACPDSVMEAIDEYERLGKFKDVREGVISNYDEKKATADIALSLKHSVTVNINPNEKVNVGDKIDVVVTKARGHLNADASSKTAQIERLKQELIKEIQTPTSAYIGLVKEIVYNGSNVFNGFIVDIKGVKCFMPGTESDVVPLNDFNDLLGKELYVMPVNQIKDSIIVSHKEYLNTKKPSVLDRLLDLDKGSVVTGVVSSIKHFGAFILIDECVATLLSVSEMNEVTEAKFKNGQLKVGDAIDFYIDSINTDDEKVIITQTVSKTEGWDKLKETIEKTQDYKLKGTVKNLFDNGVVVLSEEFNGITFFLSSKVVELDKLSVGQEVELPVESVDTVKKTVRLKIS